jgi:hypothetical protein
MSALFVVSAILSIVGGILSIRTWIGQRRLERRVRSGAVCMNCGVAASHPDADQPCPRSPAGHRFGVDLHLDL